MDPEVWGPHGWQFLHSITLAYPDNPTLEDKNNHTQFFNSIQNILPCQSCRDHYSLSLQELPVEQHLENKESLFRWLVDIHNRVNVKIINANIHMMKSLNFMKKCMINLLVVN